MPGPCTTPSQRRLIQKALDEATAAGIDPFHEPVIVDIDSSQTYAAANWSHGYSKTITRARGATGYYCTSLGRRLVVSEMLRLQGFRHDTVSWQQAGTARTNMGKACGNSMTKSILERLLPRVLYSCGLIDDLPVDHWEDPSYNPFK